MIFLNEPALASVQIVYDTINTNFSVHIRFDQHVSVVVHEDHVENKADEDHVENRHVRLFISLTAITVIYIIWFTTISR